MEIQESNKYGLTNIKICNKNQSTKRQVEQKERDNIRTKELQERGYRVIRLWEHEIKVMELNDLKEKLG